MPAPLRGATLALLLAGLAGCGPHRAATPAATAPRYAETTGSPRALLTFYVPRTAPDRPRWSAWIYRDARQCRGPAVVASDEARATDRDVHVPAGQPLTLRLSIPDDGSRRAACDATATFLPEPDHHYVAEFNRADARCPLRITDYMYQGRGLPSGALAVTYTARRPQAGAAGGCAPGELPGATP